MKVIATAGHVDHGKSALVEALTGTHPDRLKEEKEREMTIDLGFAWLDLPGGERVGIIDVPGHRDFIDNMLAGVGAIDAVILVVAADEGIMPQTREHLAILDLLEVERGIVAMTKVDLVRDEEWLDFVKKDIYDLLEPTKLSKATFVQVSALTGIGLDELRAALETVLAESPVKVDAGRPRLPVDRSFSIAGFGTIVTGTLVDGSFSIGDDIVLLPSGKHGRIRGLQTHSEEIKIAIPGSRVAINISGLDVDDVQRGQVVVKPSHYQATRRLDIKFRLLGDAVQEIKHDQQVKLFHATTQRQARIRLLGLDRIEPGQSGWMQIELLEPIVAARGDHIILRRPSPGATLGGGMVIDPHPARRHRRMDKSVVERLKQLASGTAGDVVEAVLKNSGPLNFKVLSEVVNLQDEAFREGVKELIVDQRALQFVIRDQGADDDTFLIDRQSWQKILASLIEITRDYHKRLPLRRGIPLQELRSRLAAEGKIKNAIINLAEEEHMIRLLGDQVALFDFTPQLTAGQSEQVSLLMHKLDRNPYSTPSVKELKETIGEELLGYLTTEGILARVGEDVVFRAETYRDMVEQVTAKLSGGGTLSVADVRDMFSTSRKYALALMEHLDQIKVTVREGDVRRLA